MNILITLALAAWLIAGVAIYYLRQPDPYNDPRYEKIYAPLKAGKGTKENPLTMDDLKPLMEELQRLEAERNASTSHQNHTLVPALSAHPATPRSVPQSLPSPDSHH